MCQLSERVIFIITTTVLILFLGIQFNVLYIFELFKENRLHGKYIGLGVFLAITFNTFFLLTLYTYYKTAFTSPGRPVFDKDLIEEVKGREFENRQEKQTNVNYSSLSNNSKLDEEMPSQENIPSSYGQKDKPYHSQQQYQLAAPPQIHQNNNQLMNISENQQLQQQLYEVEELEDIHTTNPVRCQYCESFKIVRVHHCRVCGYCIFRRDHHCIWIGSCVGLKNHKFFMLFLIYAAVSLFQITIPVLCDFLNIGIDIMDARYNIAQYVILSTSMVISGAFTISLLGLFFFQLYISSHNQTTLEIHNGMTSNNRINFSRGSRYNNLVEVFGEKFSYRWFLPLTPRFSETYKIYCEDKLVEII